MYYGKGKKYGKRGRGTRNEENRKDESFGWRCNIEQII
jgi:hypothetical protein